MQINRQSYEEYFVLYADGELNESEKKAVEEFIDRNPDLADELSLMQQAVLKPDGSIVFENKELLFRDEPAEGKVIYMRWFRIAAAAAFLLALTLVAWIFAGNRDARKEPVAIVKTQQPKSTVPGEIVTVNESPVQQDAATPKAGRGVIPSIGQDKHDNRYHSTSHQQQIESDNKGMTGDSRLREVGPSVKNIERTAFTHAVVTSEPGKEPIDVAVTPRALEGNNQQQPGSNVSYAQSYSREPDDDMIYFANTSLTKKTKLRGVLRKATRYLDRVTSLQ